MTNDFYNEDIPVPFEGIVEEEPEMPGKKRRKLLFASGMLGPMGYMGNMDGPAFPFFNPLLVEEEVDEDPNP